MYPVTMKPGPSPMDSLTLRAMHGDQDAAEQLDQQRAARADADARWGEIEREALAEYREECARFAAVFAAVETAAVELAAAGAAVDRLVDRHRRRVSLEKPQDMAGVVERGPVSACGRALSTADTGEALLAAVAGPLGRCGEMILRRYQDVLGAGQNYVLPKAGGD